MATPSPSISLLSLPFTALPLRCLKSTLVNRLIQADMAEYVAAQPGGGEMAGWAATSEWARDTGGDPVRHRLLRPCSTVPCSTVPCSTVRADKDRKAEDRTAEDTAVFIIDEIWLVRCCTGGPPGRARALGRGECTQHPGWATRAGTRSSVNAGARQTIMERQVHFQSSD